jgi:hypothetical protein
MKGVILSAAPAARSSISRTSPAAERRRRGVRARERRAVVSARHDPRAVVDPGVGTRGARS